MCLDLDAQLLKEDFFVWIITKKTLINSQHCALFYENDAGETYAVCNTEDCIVSRKNVLHSILDALKNGENFLEVE